MAGWFCALTYSFCSSCLVVVVVVVVVVVPQAFKEGRMEKDPSEFWYKGEIGFFDFYIIPLAKKLKECGVFGVSCDEVSLAAMHCAGDMDRLSKQDNLLTPPFHCSI